MLDQHPVRQQKWIKMIFEPMPAATIGITLNQRHVGANFSEEWS